MSVSRKRLNLTGEDFGRLKVIQEAPRRGYNRHWTCLCKCGNTCEVAAHCLRSGRTQSCGCLSAELAAARWRTHGETGSPEHKVWMSMINRCHNKKDLSHYPCHGGRGITVCDRWRHSFEAFLEDVGPHPSDEHSIERIDNDGHYEPGNVRWATTTEQCSNRRSNVWLEHDGLKLTVSQWEDRLGFPRNSIGNRIRRGWPADQALTTPLRRWPSQT